MLHLRFGTKTYFFGRLVNYYDVLGTTDLCTYPERAHMMQSDAEGHSIEAKGGSSALFLARMHEWTNMPFMFHYNSGSNFGICAP